MEHASPIAAWESYYVIIGSSAAALTGLQFVVMTLIGADQKAQGDVPEVRAFGTPTVVHFCAALLISGILSAPWPRISAAGVALGVCGAAGVGYGAVVMSRARAEMRYKPVLEDWIWHGVMPLLAYGSLVVASVTLADHAVHSLFVIAGVAMLLVFTGIHNAWDTVTWIAVERNHPPGGRKA
jgi:hypothetical protein